MNRAHENDQTDRVSCGGGHAKAGRKLRLPIRGFFIFSKDAYGGLKVKIKPLGDHILVKRIAEEEKTKGGIIIPDTAKEKPQEGRVMAVGPGKTLDDGKVMPPEVKAGDKILFGKYSGSDIKLEGEEHLIIREDDILGVIEG
ncbi:MAG: co-chaperone GroES [Deltaproteobacteria bacterium]|nr:co-chaperone GroES [Deltaproteobacteria bacterium]